MSGEEDPYKITGEAWNAVAMLYKDRFMDLDLYNGTYDAFCRLIQKQDAAIFEIGCGPGNITRYLLSQKPDFKIEAIDVAPNMVALAKSLNPGAAFKVMDCRELDAVTGPFDGIVCGFCIPYLSGADCLKLLKDCSRLLKPGGVLYLSAIEGDEAQSGYEYSSNGQYKTYVYYYQARHLQYKLKESGFEPVEPVRIHYTKADGTPQVHLVFIAPKD